MAQIGVFSPATQEEQEKFQTLGAGIEAVRVVGDIDNPIPVTIEPSADDTTTNTFGTASSVASATLTSIVSLTVPIGKVFYVQMVEASGTNIATYTIEIASTVEAKFRTWFNGDMGHNFPFASSNGKGAEVAAGVTVEVKVIHTRPMVGDFEARILGILEDL